MKTKPRRTFDESGGSIAEMVVCLPLFLTVMCGIVDVTYMGFAHLSADNAAYAACRMAAANPDSTDDEVLECAKAAAPALAETLSVDISVGAVEKTGYVHHLPAERGGFEDRASYVSAKEVTAKATASPKPLTFVGRAIAQAAGSEAFEVESTHTAKADATVEGGVSTW